GVSGAGAGMARREEKVCSPWVCVRPPRRRSGPGRVMGRQPSVNRLQQPVLPDSVHTVKDVNRLVKQLIEGDQRLQAIAVMGEISNFKRHTSGHMYFTLKDEEARLRCVMFRSRNQHLRFVPQDGMSVVAWGSLGVYEVAGEYQLYVEDMFPGGVGRLYAAFEALKAKLE